MSKHNYTNPAFCQNSEFYPVPSSSAHVESIYNRSLQLNFSAVSQRQPSRDPREGPLRMQRSMSTRSVTRKQQQQQGQGQGQQGVQAAKQQHKQSASGRYALVPLEELGGPGFVASRYAIVPGQAAQRLARSQDHLDRYGSRHGLQSDEEPHSFHEEPQQQQQETQFASLPPTLEALPPAAVAKPAQSKIKHAFSSDFGSKTFLIVDKNSNQRYQMVPTAEDEELVDENQEIIQMHNGRAHRYAVIPTEADDDELQEVDEQEEEETCLSSSELSQQQHQQQQQHYGMRTSTPQQQKQRQAAAATRALHELLSTPRKMQPPPRLAHSTPRNAAHHEQLQRERRLQLYQSQQFIHMQQQQHQQSTLSVAPSPALPLRQQRLSPQRLHYETVKPAAAPPPQAQMQAQTQLDRSMAVISPRVQPQQQQQQQQELDLSSLQGKSQRNHNSSYPQKLANATITLAIVSLMLVVGSTMNAGLIIYMIAYFGKSFYLQFGLVASFCGIGLGFLGFRSRHCEWLPNRSYTSGYILVTLFCLFKCCGLLLILVLDPIPGLPLHDVTTGVILGLSTFTMFFIGLGVMGSLWCYRPPPDNRVNVV